SSLITNMTTLYGSTRFRYFDEASTNYDRLPRRAVLITEPTEDKQLYAYCDYGPHGVNTDVLGEEPLGVYRNSYHWNRAQYDAISTQGKTNVLDMPDADYWKAETKHWLHGLDEYVDDIPIQILSDTLNAIGKPVDAGGVRHQTSFVYQGQTSTNSPFIGTLKQVTQINDQLTVGSPVMDIQRNIWGRPTVVTYYNAGHPAKYTNVFDADGRILQKVLGPRGEQVRAYVYHPVITNLMVAVTNAGGEAILYAHDTNN